MGFALVAGLCLRAWFIGHADGIAGDTTVYGEIAKNWLLHGVYGLDKPLGGLRPTLIRLPGYPMFLAGCFAVFGMEHYRAVLNVQAALDLLSCGLIAATAWRVFGRRAGLAALWLAALCPFTANYVAAGLTETLSVLCLAAAFYALERWGGAGRGVNGWVWMLGGSLGYAVLLRPEQCLLAAAVILAMAWAVWRGERGFAGAQGLAVVLTAVLAVAPLGPWAVRNWRTFGVLQPLAPRQANDPGEPVWSGFQRWYRTWGVDFISTDQVYWHYDSDAILVTDLPERAFDSAEQRERTAALLDEYNETDTGTPAFDARFAELARERVKAGWWRYWVKLPAARLANMLLRPRTELLSAPLDWWRWREHPRDSLVAALFGVVNLGYLALGAVGWWRVRGSGDTVLLGMVLFVVLRCALLLTLDNSEPRYTLELFPMVIVWAGGVCGRG